MAVTIDRLTAPARVAIVSLDAATSRTRFVAAPSLPAAYVKALSGRPIVDAGTSGQRANEIVDGSLDDLAASYGYDLAWSRLLQDRDQRPIGLVLVHRQRGRRASPRACEHVDALARLVCIAIESESRASALRSANERFAALTANIPGVVYQRRVDPDGDIRYTFISDGARELFGVSAEEILRDPHALFSCHGPSYRKDFRERLIKASRTLSIWDVEAEIITRSGERKWTHAIARPRRMPDGAVLWDGIILDATRIATREQHLQRAKDEAEMASRSKSEFIASMSHELRTPLNAIIGFSEVMTNELYGPLGDERYRGYCRDVLQSGQHLLGIINDVLDISRVEAGKLQLAEEEVDVGASIQAAVRLVQERAERGGVELSVDVAPDLPPLRADQRLLKQIVANLLSNAVKFTKKGGRSQVRAHRRPDGGLEITVEDTGIGMAPEEIPRALERFWQADSSLGRRYEGTGLGLPLVKAFTELHGGTLTLESTPGVGTKATVRFPWRRTVRPAEPSAAAAGLRTGDRD
jgi:signal transduction histidine kinase